MAADTRQRGAAVNGGRPYRRVVRMFDGGHRQQGMIEDISGGEGPGAPPQPHSRVIRQDNRCNFGKMRAIAQNIIKAPNRFRCANYQETWLLPTVRGMFPAHPTRHAPHTSGSA